MSGPSFTLRDVVDKKLSAKNQMERNTTKQPPNQPSSCKHNHHVKYHPQCKYLKHQGSIANSNANITNIKVDTIILYS